MSQSSGYLAFVKGHAAARAGAGASRAAAARSSVTARTATPWAGAARALAARATGRGRGRRGRGRQRPPSSAAIASQLVRWQRLLLGRLRASPRSTRAGTRAASASYAKGESARRLSKHKSNEQGKHGWGVADAAKASFEPECAGCRRPHLEIEEEDRHTPTPGWARRRHHWARVRSMRGRRENAHALGDRCLAIGASAKAAASSMWEKRYSHGRLGPQTRAGFPYGKLPTLTTRSAASPSSQKGTDGRRPTAVDAAALRGLQLAAIYGNDLQPVCVDLFH